MRSHQAARKPKHKATQRLESAEFRAMRKPEQPSAEPEKTLPMRSKQALQKPEHKATQRLESAEFRAMRKPEQPSAEPAKAPASPAKQRNFAPIKAQ